MTQLPSDRLAGASRPPKVKAIRALARSIRALPGMRHVLARPRLLSCLLIGIISFVFWPAGWHLPTRLLVSWNLATWLYIVLALIMMARASEATIQRRAALGDESRFVVLTLAIVASVACLGAIVAQLGAVKDAQGLLKTLHLVLAAATIVSAWTFIHLIFAQHYAHEFFVERQGAAGVPEAERGGLHFPGTAKPGFLDFLYFSFVIGVASQTADVDTTSRAMRFVVLIHGILSFFFNTTILALTINIAAGLI